MKHGRLQSTWTKGHQTRRLRYFLHAQRNLFSIIDPTNFSPIQNSNLPTPGVCLSAKESIQFHLPFHLKADGSLLWRNRTNCENLLFSRFSISTAGAHRKPFSGDAWGLFFLAFDIPAAWRHKQDETIPESRLWRNEWNGSIQAGLWDWVCAFQLPVDFIEYDWTARRSEVFQQMIIGFYWWNASVAGSIDWVNVDGSSGKHSPCKCLLEKFLEFCCPLAAKLLHIHSFINFIPFFLLTIWVLYRQKKKSYAGPLIGP